MRSLLRVLLVVLTLSSALWQISFGKNPPGQEKTFKTKVLETGAKLIQKKSPLKEISMYLDGFHFYADNLGHQMEAHHYCSQVKEDFVQCIVYDGSGADASLVAVEYIVGADLFRTLPEEERRLWHSHGYEVTSGLLVAPGLPVTAEHELIEKVVGTYGKIWQTWDTHNALPLGIPKLMMGFTRDNQVNDQLVRQRDQRLKISTTDRKHRRADIVAPPLIAGANSWESGKTPQLDLTEKQVTEK